MLELSKRIINIKRAGTGEVLILLLEQLLFNHPHPIFGIDALLLNSNHHFTREQCETNIAEALNEIHRQAGIISEFSERLSLLNLSRDE